MKRLSLLLLFLAGCGQSGPLYIPGDPSRMEVPPSEATSDEDGDEENGDGTE